MFRKLMLGALALLGLSACGERVTVNTGEVGKQITTSGLEKRIRDAGAFKMDWCAPWSACPKLVRLQVAVAAETVTIDKVFLPKSNVTLDNVTFGLQFRVKRDKNYMNRAFEEIRSEATNSSRQRIITSEMIFATYIERKAPEAVIAALRAYTVEEALSEVDTIAEYVKDQVNLALADTPIEVTEFGFPNGVGVPPQVVLTAKERLYAIDEEKARDIKALEAALSIEDQRQAVQRKRSEDDKAIADSLGISVEEYMLLKTLERFADAAEAGTPIAIGGQYIPMTKE